MPGMVWDLVGRPDIALAAGRSETRQKVMVTDGFGPFLEELFDRCSRYFGVYSLALLADQMLSRLEWFQRREALEGPLEAFAIAYSALETSVYSGTTTELTLGHDLSPKRKQKLAGPVSHTKQLAQKWSDNFFLVFFLKTEVKTRNKYRNEAINNPYAIRC